MKTGLLLLIPFLGGCASAAIQVQEVDGQCQLTGAVFTPTILEQAAPTPGVDYQFRYSGERCEVYVTGGEEPVVEE